MNNENNIIQPTANNNHKHNKIKKFILKLYQIVNVSS